MLICINLNNCDKYFKNWQEIDQIIKNKMPRVVQVCANSGDGNDGNVKMEWNKANALLGIHLTCSRAEHGIWIFQIVLKNWTENI